MSAGTSATVAIVLLAIGTYALKSVGPLLLAGTDRMPRWLTTLAALAPVPLLAALTATATVVTDGRIQLDARLAGLAAAIVALALRAPFVVVVVAAALATAAVRALVGG